MNSSDRSFTAVTEIVAVPIAAASMCWGVSMRVRLR